MFTGLGDILSPRSYLSKFIRPFFCSSSLEYIKIKSTLTILASLGVKNMVAKIHF